MAELIFNIPTIILNKNDLNAPTIRQRLSKLIKKHDTTILFLKHEAYFFLNKWKEELYHVLIKRH